jgi:hypothetical protein
MNVAVHPKSRANELGRAKAGIPGGEPQLEIVPGIPQTPKHNLRFFGGRTIQNLTYTNFYIGDSASWKESDIKNIDHALAAAMSDTNLNNVMVQYFKNQPIGSTFKPSQILPGAKPKSFSQDDVEALLAKLHKDGKLAGYDFSSTVFNFFLPSGTTLTTDTTRTSAGGAASVERSPKNPAHPEDEVSSLQGLGGYHGSIHPSPDTTIYYAIGAYSEPSPTGGHDNGIVAFDEPWKNIVAVFYHELQEARTDPDVQDAILAGNDPKAMRFLGWMSNQGEECGDFPVFETGGALDMIMQEVQLTDGSGKVPVQFQYSNAVKGPEGPIAAPHEVAKH